MGKALTEGALPMLSNYPKVQGWLRDWLLQQFQDDPLHRQIYRNISTQKGVCSPKSGTWEDRAVDYWDRDHASDYETQYDDDDDDDDDEGDGNVLSRHTSHEPGVDGNSMPFTQFDEYPSLSLGFAGYLNVKMDISSHGTQPNTTSLPSRMKLPSPLSSSPMPTPRNTVVASVREQRLSFPPPHGQHHFTPMPDLRATQGFAVNGQQLSHNRGPVLLAEARPKGPDLDETPWSMETGTSRSGSQIPSASGKTRPAVVLNAAAKKESARRLSLPKIITTHVEDDPSQSVQTLGVQPQIFRFIPDQSPDSMHCDSPLSDLLVLEVRAPARTKFDHDGDQTLVMGRRERFGNMISNLRHYRRLSGSYVLGSHDTNHAIDRKW
jgi:hypothetical protein